MWPALQTHYHLFMREDELLHRRVQLGKLCHSEKTPTCIVTTQVLTTQVLTTQVLTTQVLSSQLKGSMVMQLSLYCWLMTFLEKALELSSLKYPLYIGLLKLCYLIYQLNSCFVFWPVPGVCENWPTVLSTYRFPALRALHVHAPRELLWSSHSKPMWAIRQPLPPTQTPPTRYQDIRYHLCPLNQKGLYLVW